MRTVSLLVVVLFLSACAQQVPYDPDPKLAPKGAPREVAAREPDEMAATPTTELAWTYGYFRELNRPTPQVRTELERRSAFTAEQWDRIDRAKIALGDSEALVLMAWGIPSDTPRLTTAAGTTKVMRYNRRGARVYLTNDVITAIGQ